MTVLQLHHDAMFLADVADQLLRKGDDIRASRFYGYAAKRELAAANGTTVEPSHSILKRSADALHNNSAILGWYCEEKEKVECRYSHTAMNPKRKSWK